MQEFEPSGDEESVWLSEGFMVCTFSVVDECWMFLLEQCTHVSSLTVVGRLLLLSAARC